MTDNIQKPLCVLANLF